MQTVHAYTRLTHKYRDGYRHLDSEEFFATVRLTPAKQVVAPESYDDGGEFVQHLRVPAGVNITQLAAALANTMGGSNCRHEHDCCGCANSYISIQKVGKRRLVVRTSITYNY